MMLQVFRASSGLRSPERQAALLSSLFVWAFARQENVQHVEQKEAGDEVLLLCQLLPSCLPEFRASDLYRSQTTTTIWSE